jgi:hypothetical protein
MGKGNESDDYHVNKRSDSHQTQALDDWLTHKPSEGDIYSDTPSGKTSV